MAGILYDISPPISPDLPVWPGDTPVSREVILEMQRGDNLTLSTLHSTVHAGSHADGPSHYGADAPSIEACDPNRYVGKCQVIRVAARAGERFGVEDVGVEITAPRVLFCTGTFPDPHAWREDFAALEPSLVEWLGERGVDLVGVDTPSVDLFSSKTLEAHQAFLRRGMLILEGLMLDEVPEREYELIALPLKLVGFDASPVRAVLRE